MTARGRGSTRRGRAAVLPSGRYEPASPVEIAGVGVVVQVHGEDGRRRVLPVDQLPLPGWHQPLAAALADRTGPSGRLRTSVSAKGLWASTARFLRFLDTLRPAPGDPSKLTADHLEAFRRHRFATIGAVYAWRDVRDVGKVLQSRALRGLVSTEVLDYASRRVEKAQPVPKPGYSDREFVALVSAARADVANIRDRIRAGERLVERYRSEPDTLDPSLRERAALLTEIAATGAVSWPPGPLASVLPRRRDLAGHLFLTLADLAPLLVLLVAVTGWNIETIKELPIEHRVLEDRAVELRIVKRRRGPHRWTQTVTWEIGRPSRQLHTPGGLYLLLHELTRPSRGFSGSRLLWSVWRNGHRARVHGAAEHFGVFDEALDTNLYASDWARRHNLTADAATTGPRPEQTDTPASTVPLLVDFNRLKTSIEVRRTKQMGGHLPSATRTNSIPVLFRNYLRGDPSVVEWAQQIMGDALNDAEQSALAAHQRALDTAGGGLRIVSGPVDPAHLEHAGLDTDTAHRAVAGQIDTAWSACTDHDHHPGTGRTCRESFLDCFHCGNCLITRNHLPQLLGLLDALDARRQQLSDTEWWARYGMAWVAIRLDILGKFSPAEIDHAQADKITDAMLDLVENRWEHP
jgi:hypothetical protein